MKKASGSELIDRTSDRIGEACERIEELFGRRAELEGGPLPVTIRVPGWVVLAYVNGDGAITTKAYSNTDLLGWVDRALLHRMKNPADDWVSAMIETEES